MNNELKNKYLNLLKKEISLALGCTEPAAVALAVAYAADALGHIPDKVEIKVSEYILKNGMNVGIPNTGMLGLHIAGALGAVAACPGKKLMVLNGIQEKQKNIAVKMVDDGKISIGLAETSEKVYIEVTAAYLNHKTKAVISQMHTNLSYLEKDSKVLVQTAENEKTDETVGEDYTCTLSEIVEFIDQVDVNELSFLNEMVKTNFTISQEGLEHNYGLGVGRNMLGSNNLGLISEDIGNYAVACTAAAADARMSGCDKPVMSAAGSGNQGLTASVPIISMGHKLGKSVEEILKPLALSVLVTIHTKHFIGRLSVLCGCAIAAAIGTCCGVIYMFGGGIENMKYGIKTMVADISGIVCDGAKPGCALKIATAVTSANRAAAMALQGIGADSHDGIVDIDVEKTLENLGTLGNQGMIQANTTILDIMLDKKNN